MKLSTRARIDTIDIRCYTAGAHGGETAIDIGLVFHLAVDDLAAIVPERELVDALAKALREGAKQPSALAISQIAFERDIAPVVAVIERPGASEPVRVREATVNRVRVRPHSEAIAETALRVQCRPDHEAIGVLADLLGETVDVHLESPQGDMFGERAA